MTVWTATRAMMRAYTYLQKNLCKYVNYSYPYAMIKVPTSFDSIPVLNNQNATFYYFIGDRADEDIL